MQWALCYYLRYIILLSGPRGFPHSPQAVNISWIVLHPPIAVPEGIPPDLQFQIDNVSLTLEL